MSKTKIKTNIKAGRAINHNTTRIKTQVKAGSGLKANHNLVRL